MTAFKRVLKSTITNVVEEEEIEITSDSSKQGGYDNVKSSDTSESNWPVVVPSSRWRPTPYREFTTRRK